LNPKSKLIPLIGTERRDVRRVFYRATLVNRLKTSAKSRKNVRLFFQAPVFSRSSVAKNRDVGKIGATVAVSLDAPPPISPIFSKLLSATVRATLNDASACRARRRSTPRRSPFGAALERKQTTQRPEKKTPSRQGGICERVGSAANEPFLLL